MLQNLRIKNFALIEDLSINFSCGFTTLTGETGAGKSILLDALGMVLGNRAETSLIRNGANKADIIAQFELSQLNTIQQWLIENDIEDDSDNLCCIIRRTINKKSASKSYINGINVPMSLLKILGEKLVDIHGQNEHQSLIKPAQQLNLLDSYACITSEVTQLIKLFKKWQYLEKTLAEKENQFKENSYRQTHLELQLEELQKISPQEGEFSELSKEQLALSHAKDILQLGKATYQTLEADEQHNAITSINIAITNLEKLIEYNSELNTQLNQLNNILIDLQETSTDIRHLTQNTELDPARLELVEERLSQIYGLSKKHAVEPDKLVAKIQQLQSELSEIQQDETCIEQIKSDLQEVQEKYLSTAKEISIKRYQSAYKLSQAVMADMHKLGMENGQFKIELQDTNPMTTGIDKIQFLVTANQGQPLQPLNKVASGGELSRISLAIQVATTEVAKLPTLIFDEVDVGIGGAIAEIVGQKMQQLANNRQILAVTHLPQVASHGKQHLLISKNNTEHSTITQINKLSHPQRIEELARMLGGMTITENTRQHATEMLLHAQSKI